MLVDIKTGTVIRHGWVSICKCKGKTSWAELGLSLGRDRYTLLHKGWGDDN